MSGAVAPGIAEWPKDGQTGWGLRFKGPQMEVKWLAKETEAADRCADSARMLPGDAARCVRAAGGGWDSGLHQRGNVDNEVSMRLWLLGYELRIVPEVVVRHRFRKSSPFPVGWPQYLHNRLRLAFVHFNPSRLARVVSSLRQYPSFGEAMALMIDGNIGARRREIIFGRSEMMIGTLNAFDYTGDTGL